MDLMNKIYGLIEISSLQCVVRNFCESLKSLTNVITALVCEREFTHDFLVFLLEALEGSLRYCTRILLLLKA